MRRKPPTPDPSPPVEADPLPLASLDKPPPDPAIVEQVRQWFLQGGSEHYILDAIRTNYPTHDAAELLMLAMRALQRVANWNPEIVAGFVFEATREVYRRALEAQDLPTALRALKQLTTYVPVPAETEDDDEADATTATRGDDGSEQVRTAQAPSISP